MAKKYFFGLLACVVLVCVMCIFIGFAPRPVREPAEGFLTIEEEYIQAVEDYLKLGKVTIPKGATFSISEDQITIEDSDSNATLHCKTVLQGTVPVYTYSYSKHSAPLVGLLFIFYCLASYNIVKGIYEIIKLILNRFPYLTATKHQRKIYKLKKAAGKETKGCLQCHAPKDSCLDCLDCEYNKICTLCCTVYCKEHFESVDKDEKLEDSDLDDETFFEEEDDDISPEENETDDSEEDDEDPEFDLD